MTKFTLMKQAISAFVTRVLGLLSAFVLNLLVARNLTLNDAGIFFLVFSLLTILGTVSTLGLPNSFVRHIAIYSSKNRWDIVNGIFLKGILASLFAAIVLSVIIYVSKDIISIYLFGKSELAPLLAIVVLAIPSYVVYMLIGAAFRALQKPVTSVLIQNVISQVLIVAVLFLLVFLDEKLSSLLVTQVLVLSMFLTALVSIYLWFSRVKHKEEPNYSKTSALIESAKPLYVMALIGLLVQWSGQISSGIFLDSEQVALFSVAQRLSMLTSLVLVAVNLVVAPRFAALSSSGDFEKLRLTSIFCSRLMLVLATPVLILMVVFPAFFMSLFGEQYSEGSHLLQILVIGQFINVVTGSVGYLLNMTGHERIMRNVVLIFGPLAIFLSILLTPLLGATGAAIATAIVLSGQNLLAVYKVKKHLGFNTLKIF